MRVEPGRFSNMNKRKLAERRAWIASLTPEWLPNVSVTEVRIPRAQPSADSDVIAYVVNAQAGQAGPGVLHMHGGGFNASSAKAGMRNVQELAQSLNCTVVTVDYRLAPETTYDGSLEDNYIALRWMYSNASTIGVDPQRIAVVGESAGGGHAALLAITARDRGEVPILFQALSYPMLDDRTGSSRAVAPHVGQFVWSAEANRYGWRCFLGCKPGMKKLSANGVPARITDLAGLPPTFIGVGALDLFAEECMTYAARLLAAAVPTELVVVPGAFHGFDMMAKDAGVSRRFTQLKLDALQRALHA